jgi:hypothetical protein
MKKENREINDQDTMRQEYEFDYSKAVWAKHAQRIREEGSNVVLLDADVYEIFRDSASVNKALRQVIEMGKLTKHKKSVRHRGSEKTAAKVA